jgi:polyisoprenoid-binding protein YceI
MLVENPLVYGEYSISFTSFSVLLFIAIGYLMPQLIALKTYAISKIFGIEKREVSLAVGPVFLGILIFVASFFYSTAGIFLLSLGLWSNVLINKGQGKNLALFSLGILMVYPFLEMGGIDFVDITLGKTIEGLLFGVFAVLFISRMAQSSKMRMLSPIISLILTMLLLALSLILGTQKSDLGGVDAFVAAVYGMSILILASAEKEWKSTIFLAVVLTGIIVIPLTSTIEERPDEIVSEGTNKVSLEPSVATVDPFEQKGGDLSLIPGDYSISDENMEFTFELGPKGGRTKGKFKALKGDVSIDGNVEKSKFKVELNVADLSTMNKFRDESLMGEEYFNVIKFPSISFSSKKLTAKGDGYEIQGEFTMMGITKPQTVSIELISEKGPNEMLTLIGKGAIDRTLFGMKPDPKEGNVVDFQFKIQLKPLR